MRVGETNEVCEGDDVVCLSGIITTCIESTVNKTLLAEKLDLCSPATTSLSFGWSALARANASIASATSFFPSKRLTESKVGSPLRNTRNQYGPTITTCPYSD